MNPARVGRTVSWSMILAAAGATATAETIFSSPDEAARALVTAVQSDNYPLFLSIAGAPMARFWSSGDRERDVLERLQFLDEVRRSGLKTNGETPDRKILYVGDQGLPFPAPLVKTGSGWRFDGNAGFSELTKRRISRNERAVVDLCQAFRDAEFSYLSSGKREVAAFAQRIRSTPGQHDGLFWSDVGEEDESPLGPLFGAAAFDERQPGETPRARFGYYFKILFKQGPDAVGGALDYRVNGRLSRGFALIAWPAEYGAEGIRSFLINHTGDIYYKDLGEGTARVVESMAVFNPDRSWTCYDGEELK